MYFGACGDTVVLVDARCGGYCGVQRPVEGEGCGKKVFDTNTYLVPDCSVTLQYRITALYQKTETW